MWDLVPWPGIEPRPPALEVWSLSHWTTREVLTNWLRFLLISNMFNAWVSLRVFYSTGCQELCFSSPILTPTDVRQSYLLAF